MVIPYPFGGSTIIFGSVPVVHVGGFDGYLVVLLHETGHGGSVGGSGGHGLYFFLLHRQSGILYGFL